MRKELHCERCSGILTDRMVSGFCARCILQMALDPAPSATAPDPFEAAGTVVGRYHLIAKVGEGGCGVVYIAEQREPVLRRLALKLIKPGMDTSQVIARFEAERQALAIMEHPNIARVFDAGTDDYGRPYFVMELVAGIPITKFCEEEKLNLRQRLDLFIKVCQAVQHAHQKGIIHRDIKPTNILVATFEGEPLPKVIDFGIAKATEGSLTDATVLTQVHQLMGTPAYMSPEQAGMNRLMIDTRTDIYSLGVLLYELLTGRTPFNPKELLAGGLEAFRKALRGQEPLRPSACSALELKQPMSSGRKSESHGKFKIPEDLDWIVMKCLEKEPGRRYETAAALASDILRHLNNEPVTAHAPSALYRFQKAWRRNTVGISAAVAVGAALILGATVSVWQALLAKHHAQELASERDATERMRQEAEAVATFLTEIFQGPRPTFNGRHITAVQILERAIPRLDADLAGQPSLQARLRFTLGLSFHALGNYREAAPILQKACDYYVATLGPEHPETLKARATLADSVNMSGDVDAGLKLRTELLDSHRKAFGPEHPATLAMMHKLSLSYEETGQAEAARKILAEAYELRRRVLGPEHLDTLATAHRIAAAHAEILPAGEAIRILEGVVAARKELIGEEHPDTLWAMADLAVRNSDAGRTNEALRLREKVLSLSCKINGPEHPDSIVAMFQLAMSYNETGRGAPAMELLKQASDVGERTLGPAHKYSVRSKATLADIYHEAGRFEEEERLRLELLESQRREFGPDDLRTLGAMTYLSIFYRKTGDFAKAINLQKQALVTIERVSPPGHHLPPIARENLAICHVKMGEADNADRARSQQ